MWEIFSYKKMLKKIMKIMVAQKKSARVVSVQKKSVKTEPTYILRALTFSVAVAVAFSVAVAGITVILSAGYFQTKSAYAQEPTVQIEAEIIRSYNIDINIQKNGTFDVTEKITYDYGTNQRHGFFRSIPYTITNDEGKHFKMDVHIFSVSNETDDNNTYTKSIENDRIVVKIGDPDKLISGQKEYILRYNVSGGLRYFSDHDELYWNVIGADFSIPIEKAFATVTFPEDISKEDVSKEDVSYDGRATCYVGARGSTEICSSEISGSSISYTADRQLAPYEGMTIVAGFPKGMVAQIEAQPIVSFWDTLLGKITIVGFLCALAAWYVAYPLWIILKWFKYGRDPYVGPALTSYYEGPQSSKGRILTPAETGALIDETVDIRDIMSIVVDLARRGHLTLEEIKKGEINLHKKSNTSDTLLDFEKELYDDIFDKKETVALKEVDIADTVTSVTKKIYEHLVKHDLFPKNPNTTRNFYYGMAVAGATTFNFFLMIVALIFGRAMPRKTTYGATESLKAKGLLNFLMSQDRILEYEAKKYFDFKDMQTLFEKLLPFAIAFGVEKVWMERFKDIQLTRPEWYTTYNNQPFTTGVLSSGLNSSLNSFSSAATPTRSSQGFSSGFSGGGGSSGGGGGGGGGGSW